MMKLPCSSVRPRCCWHSRHRASPGVRRSIRRSASCASPIWRASSSSGARNRPRPPPFPTGRSLARGDRLVTARGGRAEFALGTAAIRLDERTELSIADLDATTVRVELATGTASVYLRELLASETFEIVTPNTAVALHEPGEYRVDVAADDSTELTVHGGTATAATAGGPVRVADGQRVRLEGRDALARLESPRPADAFDDWVLERELRLAEAESPRFSPADDAGYDELDRYGKWYDEPRYGRVWLPYAYGGRAPYRFGHWERFGIGWTWIDPAPWGFVTFHHGRWAFLHHLHRWCWVPERRVHERHFVHDTAPFGQPRRDVRSRDIREDAPRTARRPADDDDARRPAAATRAGLRHDDVSPRPMPRRMVTRDGPVRREIPVHSFSGSRSPPRQSAVATRSAEATMRPSRASEQRSEARPSAASRMSRAFGRGSVP